MNIRRNLFGFAIVQLWAFILKWSLLLLIALPLVYLAGCGGGSGGGGAASGGQSGNTALERTLAIALNSVRTLIATNYVGRVVDRAFSPQTQPCETAGTVEYLTTHAILTNCSMNIAPQIVMNGSGVAGGEIGDFNGFTIAGALLDVDTGFTIASGHIANANSSPTANGFTNQTTLRDANVQLGSASNYAFESASIDGEQIGLGVDARFDLAIDGIVRHDGERVIFNTTVLSWGLANGGGPAGGSLEVVNSEVVGPGYVFAFEASGAITYVSSAGDIGSVSWANVRTQMIQTAQ
jgi:hypothetical protein